MEQIRTKSEQKVFYIITCTEWGMEWNETEQNRTKQNETK